MSRSLKYPFLGAVALSLICGIIWLVGSNNPETHAGYVGYLTKGSVFGKTKFVGIQKGPTSAGKTWMLNVVNVSITPYTYDEPFEKDTAVLAKDSLKLTFQVHLVWQVDQGKIQDFIENYSYLQGDTNPDKVVKDAYNNFLKEPLRTFAREEIQKENGLDVKSKIEEIGAAISAKVLKRCEGTPFKVSSVVVGNIQYPESVSNAVAEKLAATQVLERKQTEISIAEKDKLKRIVDAEGIAKANTIINGTLTPLYIQHEAIDAQKAMVNSPNHTTIYIPVGANGVPIVSTVGRTATDPATK